MLMILLSKHSKITLETFIVVKKYTWLIYYNFCVMINLLWFLCRDFVFNVNIWSTTPVITSIHQIVGETTVTISKTGYQYISETGDFMVGILIKDSFWVMLGL